VSGGDYEVLCAEILREAGWLTRIAGASGDQGADIIAEMDGVRVVLQCKLHSNSIGNKAVQEVFSAKQFQDADAAVVVSSSDFTVAARQLAHKNGVLLLHHDDLIHLEDLV
jgi:restriction system protein